MSDTELKPCPVCGGKAVFMTTNNKSSHCGVGFTFEIKCEDCGMKLPTTYNVDFSLNEEGGINILNDHRARAAEAWTRRASNE